MGSRPARQGATGPVRHLDGGQWSIDALVQLAGDERRLGRCVAAVVATDASQASLGHIKRLVIYLDNGPKNPGRRTQFLKRMVQFADRSGLEIRLVYYPPYHSKYNRIERCWSALEKKWNGVLLNSLKVVLQCALRMTWKGLHPTVKRLHGAYPDGVRVPAQEMKKYEARLQRSATLPKYDITIKPRESRNHR
jgi:DDE family transposase